MKIVEVITMATLACNMTGDTTNGAAAKMNRKSKGGSSSSGGGRASVEAARRMRVGQARERAATPRNFPVGFGRRR